MLPNRQKLHARGGHKPQQLGKLLTHQFPLNRSCTNMPFSMPFSKEKKGLASIPLLADSQAKCVAKLSESLARHETCKLRTANMKYADCSQDSNRQTHRQTDKQTYAEREGQASRQADRQTAREECSAPLTCDIMHTGGVGLHPGPLPGRTLWLSLLV